MCQDLNVMVSSSSRAGLISAYAAPIRGGATGANSVAYKDAQQFCAKSGIGLHAIVVDASERDVYQSSFGGSLGVEVVAWRWNLRGR